MKTKQHGRFVIKLFLAVIFFMVFCHAGFSEDLGIPLITLDAANMIKTEFKIAMSNLSENVTNDFGSAVIGSGLIVSLPQWSANVSGLWIKNINNWISLPLFGAVAGNLINEHAHVEVTLFGGSGLIIKNRFFHLGLMGGIKGYFTSEDDSSVHQKVEDDNYVRFEYGIYPVLNTSEYPFLRYLEKIEAFLLPNEPDSRVGKFDMLNYGLQLVFKDLFNLPVFDLYTISGHNNFMPEFDFSSKNIGIVPVSISDFTLGGIFAYGKGFVGASAGKIHKTFTYGLRVGSDSFVVDINYLMIDDLKIIKGLDTKNERIYGDYPYPFGLNGFPSVTLNWITYDDTVIYLRFSTLNALLPFVPDIGFIYDEAFLMLYSPPFNFSIAGRWLF